MTFFPSPNYNPFHFPSPYGEGARRADEVGEGQGVRYIGEMIMVIRQ